MRTVHVKQQSDYSSKFAGVIRSKLQSVSLPGVLTLRDGFELFTASGFLPAATAAGSEMSECSSSSPGVGMAAAVAGISGKIESHLSTTSHLLEIGSYDFTKWRAFSVFPRASKEVVVPAAAPSVGVRVICLVPLPVFGSDEWKSYETDRLTATDEEIAERLFAESAVVTSAAHRPQPIFRDGVTFRLATDTGLAYTSLGSTSHALISSDPELINCFDIVVENRNRKKFSIGPSQSRYAPTFDRDPDRRVVLVIDYEMEPNKLLERAAKLQKRKYASSLTSR